MNENESVLCDNNNIFYISSVHAGTIIRCTIHKSKTQYNVIIG